MDESQYLSTLKEVISLIETRTGIAPLSETTQILSDLNLDSLQAMELITTLEDHFKRDIPLEYMPQIVTIGDAAKFIQNAGCR